MRLLLPALLVLPATVFAQDDTPALPDPATPTEAVTETATEAVAEAVDTATEGAAEAAEAVTEAVTDAAETVADTAPSPEPAIAVTPTEDGGESVTMLSDVLFPFGEARLRPEAEGVLREAAEIIAGKQGIVIQGHTDDVGSDAFNQALGLARAEAVRDWLVSEGLDPAAFATVSAGEGAPKLPNRAENGADLPENRAKNRRVEFVLPGEG